MIHFIDSSQILWSNITSLLFRFFCLIFVEPPQRQKQKKKSETQINKQKTNGCRTMFNVVWQIRSEHSKTHTHTAPIKYILKNGRRWTENCQSACHSFHWRTLFYVNQNLFLVKCDLLWLLFYFFYDARERLLIQCVVCYFGFATVTINWCLSIDKSKCAFEPINLFMRWIDILISFVMCLCVCVWWN